MSSDSVHDRTMYLLARVCKLDHQRMHESLEGLGLYRGQPSVLRALWQQDGIPNSELAKRLNRSSATITMMVKRMEKAGFVERRSDPNDERISRVYLTPTGRGARAALENVFETFEEQTFAGFDGDEIAVLRGFLQRIIGNMEGKSWAKQEE